MVKGIVFDGCRGWLHGDRGQRGAIIVSSFAYEELCARHSLRLLADMLAEQGVPTLRFDPFGTGDSLGTGLEDNLLTIWTSNLNAAIETLKATTGATDVALIGLRLGALMVADCAANRADIGAIALLAPPQSGRSFARETAILQQIVGPQPLPADAPFDGLALAGFRYSANLMEGIRAFQYPTKAPATNILLMGPEPLAPLESLANLWQGAGKIETRFFAGYAEMMCDPTASRPPRDALAAIADFIGHGSPAAAKTPEPQHALTEAAFTETPLVLAAPHELVGILCEPAAKTTRAALYLNTGAIHHIGWGRATVTASRAFAADGTATLRLDLGGLGDSPDVAGRPDMPLYDTGMQDDIAAAITALEQRGYTDIALIGHCAGAHQAFHYARNDPRVKRLALVNQLCFVWGPDYALRLNAWQVGRAAQMEIAKGSDKHSALGAALLMVRHWIGPSAKVALALARRAINRLSGKNDIVLGGFRALSARGVPVLIGHSDTDESVQEIEIYAGEDAQALAGMQNVKRVFLGPSDHTISHSSAQQTLLAELRDRLR